MKTMTGVSKSSKKVSACITFAVKMFSLPKVSHKATDKPSLEGQRQSWHARIGKICCQFYNIITLAYGVYFVLFHSLTYEFVYLFIQNYLLSTCLVCKKRNPQKKGFSLLILSPP